MNLRRFLLIILFGSCIGVHSQELNSPQLSQYLADNAFVLAPTYARVLETTLRCV